MTKLIKLDDRYSLRLHEAGVDLMKTSTTAAGKEVTEVAAYCSNLTNALSTWGKLTVIDADTDTLEGLTDAMYAVEAAISRLEPILKALDKQRWSPMQISQVDTDTLYAVAEELGHEVESVIKKGKTFTATIEGGVKLTLTVGDDETGFSLGYSDGRPLKNLIRVLYVLNRYKHASN